jgi:GxxExxY protein
MIRIMDEIQTLCGRVREIAFAIHVYLGHGHLEKVYENALTHRLQKAGLHVARQSAVQVRDEDGTVIGEFVPDLLVARFLLVELKAVRHLGAEHEAQMLGYLKATSLEHGLLINFGAYRFQIRKFARRPQPL